MRENMETLDITVGEPPEQSIVLILKHIRPGWDSDKLVIKELKGGNMNRLHYCGLTDDKDENDVVLVKVYGGGTGWLDRDKEVMNMGVAHSVGLAAPLHCRFANGLVYKYCRGDIVTSHTVYDETYARGMARKLAALHLVDLEKVLAGSQVNNKTNKLTVINTAAEIVKSMMEVTKDSYDDPWKENIRVSEFPNKQDALAELEGYVEEVENMGFPTCFCHNDVTPANSIYDATTGDIQLIDWEMCGMDHAAHEIGWYFATRVMVDDCAEEGLSFYPDKEYQLKWIRWYLEHRAELCGKDNETISEEEIKRIYKGSIRSALMRTIGVVAFFLMEDQISHVKKGSFRKARHFQKLFWIIKDRHYRPEECS